MATMDIENVERRQYIRRKTNLRIAIGTSREKIEQAVALVGDALRDHEGMPADRPPRVYFHEFDPDSLKHRHLLLVRAPGLLGVLRLLSASISRSFVD